MKNTKGLSAIVTTLLIILLAIVAIGVIWVVVRGVVDSGTEGIELNAKCVAVDISAVSVVEVPGEAGNYTVTLYRNSEGEAIGGIKLNVFNATDNSGVTNFGATLDPLDTVSQKVEGVTGANRLEYTVYFLDASKNEQPCTQTKTFNF